MQMRSLRRRPRHLALQSLTRGLKGKIPFLCKESKFPFCKKKGILSATSFSDRIPLKKDGNFVRECSKIHCVSERFKGREKKNCLKRMSLHK